ncbi:Fic family protein [Bdellovibrio sp. SKB1291214]|uniref:Fic family protein n=1 Tax=Bdellovibrio sp. SKB1291214 TaxID=1732569 RepID=UPI000B660354|nr:Fic family protein [Bdellovibrio sp. SKB1291214]UYL08503.1 Fic family protein [Bdellovibrio sp. SKB1291214]
MKSRVFTIISALSLVLASCQTPAPMVVNDPCDASRDPASERLMCAKVFENSQDLAPPITDPAAPVTFKTINKKLEWDKWIETEIDFLRFYSERSLKRGTDSNGLHGTEVWGFANYKAYVEARDILNRIPIGKLDINRSLIMKIHEAGSEGIKKEAWLMGKLMPKNMSVGNSTGFKVRQNIGGDPVFHPLKESQYEALKSNPWIKKFIELPWPLSRKEKRRGWIVYGDYRTVQSAVNELSTWYYKNKKTMDPIDLAAEFQYRFVSIHPFIDGNGRTSMLLANRILQEAGYPGVMNTFPGYDIYYDLGTWKQVFRNSVAQYGEMVRDVVISDPAVPTVNNINRDHEPRTALLPPEASNDKKSQWGELDTRLKKKFKWMNDTISAKNKFIKIGDGTYTMLTDGFFYNSMGIPHALFNRKLYPIADRTYLLYGEGGELAPHVFARRSLTLAHRKVFRDHMQYAMDLQAGKIQAKDIEVIPYDVIKNANERGDIYLHPWQVNVFENAITIKDTDPLAILAQTRGYHTDFEKSFNQRTGISMSDVVAQYQFMEMKFSKYMDYAKSVNNTNMINTIMKSREKYFEAAKSILAEGEKQIENAPASLQITIKKAPRVTFFEKYKSYTNLAFPSLKQALDARGDENIVLLRSDMGSVEKTGFISNQSYIDLAKSLPGYDSFKLWVKQMRDKVGDDKHEPKGLEAQLRKMIPGFDKLAVRINSALQNNRYDRRGVADEFAREFVDHYTHALDTPLKDHISLSTSTDLYFAYIGQGLEPNIPFLAPGLGGGIYFVRLNKSTLASTMSTPYPTEFEILSQKNISPFKIIDKVTIEHFNKEKNEKKYETINAAVDEAFYVFPE